MAPGDASNFESLPACISSQNRVDPKLPVITAEDLVRKFEGCRLTAYRDSVGILTIGYGHTGDDVEDGMRITQDQADFLLARDLERFEQGVARLAPTATPGEHAALVSFAFNLGLHRLAQSNLLKLHSAGDHDLAAAEFGRYVFGGGKRLPGLVARRAAERAVYLGEA
jgi:lysozyme